MQGNGLFRWWMPLSLLVIAVLVFAKTVSYPFVHDDLVFIVQNPDISRLDRWSEVLFKPSMSGDGTLNAYYRPVLEIVYRLQYALFGFNPAGFHASNVFLHAINGALLFFVLTRLGFARDLSYALSVLFLVHPVQTEAVACVAGISNLLCAFFMLLSALGYLQARYVLSVLAMTLAFLTKEQAIILPFVFILFDLYRSKRNYLYWGLGLVLMVCFLSIRGHITQGHLLEDILASPGELRLRLMAIPRTLLMYLGLIFYPSGLHYYRNTDILGLNTAGAIGLLLVVAAFVFLMLRAVTDRRALVFGACWFILFLSPVLNIVPLVNEYSFILTAEHFLYLPIVGVVLIAAVLISGGLDKKKASAVFVVCALFLSVLSIVQNRYWSSEIALFERMQRYEPHFGRGQILLARAYQAGGQPERALEHYRRALDIMRSYEKRSVDPQATEFYRKFIKDINLYIVQSSEALAVDHLKAGDIDRAIEAFKKALELDPQNASLLNNLAIAYLQQGDKIQAEQYFKMALGFNPLYVPARQNLDRLIQEVN